MKVAHVSYVVMLEVRSAPSHCQSSSCGTRGQPWTKALLCAASALLGLTASSYLALRAVSCRSGRGTAPGRRCAQIRTRWPLPQLQEKLRKSIMALPDAFTVMFAAHQTLRRVLMRRAGAAASAVRASSVANAGFAQRARMTIASDAFRDSGWGNAGLQIRKRQLWPMGVGCRSESTRPWAVR